jgi:hypothetical protein
VTIDLVHHGTGPIQILRNGVAPDDGFTEYLPGFNHVGRWGDYSAAEAASDGTIWVATEYIPNTPRILFTNWGTFVADISP